MTFGELQKVAQHKALKKLRLSVPTAPDHMHMFKPRLAGNGNRPSGIEKVKKRRSGKETRDKVGWICPLELCRPDELFAAGGLRINLRNRAQVVVHSLPKCREEGLSVLFSQDDREDPLHRLRGLREHEVQGDGDRSNPFLRGGKPIRKTSVQ